jgi:hypothetical protein
MKTAFCFALSAAASVLAACGSSDNNTTPAPSPTVTLSAGNVDFAARAAANAAMSSAGMADVNPVSTDSVRASGGKPTAVKTRSLQQLLLALTREVVFDRAMAKTGTAASDTPRALGTITRVENCAVSGNVTGVLDDRDNSNTVTSGDMLTVTFNQCRPNATDLIEGSVAASYSVVQVQTGFASATATVTYTQLHASSTEGDFSINGSFIYNLNRLGSLVTAQLSIGVNGLTASVTGSNYSDTVTLHAGYTVTATRDPFALPPGSGVAGLGTLTVNGAISATSLGGAIVISTPITFRQFDIDPFPREGQLQVRGANNGMLVLTVLSTSTVRVQLDANGDGTFEVDKNVPWVDLI